MANVANPSFAPRKECAICGVLENLKCCGKCRSVWYCNREHQTSDWKNHKKICKILQEKQTFSDSQNKLTCSKSNTLTLTGQGITVTTSKVEPVHASHSESSIAAEQQPITSNKSMKRKSKPNKSVNPSDSSASTSADDSSGSGSGSGSPNQDETENVTLTERLNECNINSTKSSVNTVSPATTVAGHDKATYDPRPFCRTQFPVPKSTKDGGVLANHIAKYLRQDSHCVVNDLLPVNAARAIHGEVEKLHESGSFIDGPLSGGKSSSEDSKIYSEKKIRSDKITWLQGTENEYPNICRLMQHMDSIAQMLKGCQQIQDECHVFGRTKAMVACYPSNGTGYAYHVDNPNKDGRCLTFIYYLNEGWDCEKLGGLLRILPPDGSHVDVEPILNRLLVFWSDRRNPHEVQPAWASRYAITMWYFDKEERETAKAIQRKEEINKTKKDVVKETSKSSLEEEIKHKSQSAVGTLSDEELEAIALLVDSSANPRRILSGMGVAPQVQDALLRQLEERKKRIAESS